MAGNEIPVERLSAISEVNVHAAGGRGAAASHLNIENLRLNPKNTFVLERRKNFYVDIIC